MNTALTGLMLDLQMIAAALGREETPTMSTQPTLDQMMVYYHEDRARFARIHDALDRLLLLQQTLDKLLHLVTVENTMLRGENERLRERLAKLSQDREIARPRNTR